MWLAAGLGFAADVPRGSQVAGVAGWDVQRWTVEDGLPQNNVKAIAQAPDGYLWLGTLDGLARFDGVRFTAFTQRDTPGIAGDAVNALAVDAQGTLWVAVKGGLMAWRAGKFQSWTTKDGLPGASCYQVMARPGGGVWWREGNRCGELVNGVVTRYDGRQDLTNTVWSLARARDGGLLALTSDEVRRWDPEKNRFGAAIRWPARAENWHGMEDGAGRLWASHFGHAWRWEAGAWTLLGGTNDPPDDGESRFFEDRAGRLWAASRKSGLSCATEGRRQSFAIGREPDQNGVSALFEDREGNIWAGTGGDGLYRLRPKRVRTWTIRDGLPSNNIKSVCAAPDGSVWAGTGRGPGRIVDGRVETIPSEKIPSHVATSCVLADRSGAIWLGVPQVELFRRVGQSYDKVHDPAVKSSFVDCLYEDRDGGVWMGVRDGVTVWRQGRFERRLEPQVMEKPVASVLQDRAGGMWFGTKGAGLKRWHEGKLTGWTTNSGLCHPRVTALHEDVGGAVWIGTINGLSRWKDGRFASFGEREGLAETTIHQILEDDSGHLWLSGLRGIHRVRRADLEAVAEGRATRFRCFTVGESDGMESSETNGELQPAGAKTPDGHLWFPTIKGLVEIDPRAFGTNEAGPPVVIERMTANEQPAWIEGGPAAGGQKPEASAALRIGPRGRDVLEVRYTAGALAAPEQARFQWKLEPRDPNWREAGAQRFVFLQNLRPGGYTFRVRACDQHGTWNETGASLPFVVAPWFRETWPFYALCAAGVGLAGWGIHLWRVGFLRRIDRLEKAEAVQAERMRIARDLHDSLGADLTGLALRADLAKRNTRTADAAAEFDSLAGSARALVDEMRTTVWTLDPRNDSLEGLAAFLVREAQKQAGAAGVRCRIDIPEKLPPLTVPARVRRNVLLAIKEALHNAMKHAQASEVRLAMGIADGTLRVSIADNGRGLPAGTPQGHGLRNMHDRVEEVQGRLRVEASGEGGTMTVVELPLDRLENPGP